MSVNSAREDDRAPDSAADGGREEHSVRIERALNGFVLTAADGSMKVVCEDEDEPDDRKAAAEAAAALCREVVEYFGLGGSKHDSFRISVSVADQRRPCPRRKSRS